MGAETTDITVEYGYRCIMKETKLTSCDNGSNRKLG